MSTKSAGLKRFSRIGGQPRSARETRSVERLIDRDLILQQSALEPEDAVTDKELDKQLATRCERIFLYCKQYHCETDDGWKKYLGDHGFTVEEFRERWRQRMELLKFIEVRFPQWDQDLGLRYQGLLPDEDGAGVCEAQCDSAEAGDDFEED